MVETAVFPYTERRERKKRDRLRDLRTQRLRSKMRYFRIGRK